MTTEEGESSKAGSSLVQPHHKFVGFCKTRAEYRQGRRDTAVKVRIFSFSETDKNILCIFSGPKRKNTNSAYFFLQVYTISSESKFLLVQGVPNATDLSAELRTAFETHGTLTEFERVSDYPRERFTDVYRLKFDELASAKYE